MGLEDNKPAYFARRFDGGLVTRVPAHLLRDTQSPDAQNFDPSYVGSLRKRKGYIKFTGTASTGGDNVSGLFSAALSGGTAYVIASHGTLLRDISNGSFTTISGTSITNNTRVRMDIFNDLFLICNQGGGPWKWTGTGAVATLGGSPPANARGVGIHRSRVWMYVNTSVLSFSALSDPEDWTSTDNAGSITINKGDGFIINGFQSGGDFAVISKITPATGGLEGALYGLYNGSPFTYEVKKLASIPAFSQEAMIQYDNFVAVATPRGVYGIQGRKVFKISDAIQPTFDAIPAASMPSIVLGKKLNTIRMAYPSTGTANDREFILDIERGVWGRNTGKTINRYALHPDGRLLSGTSGTSILVWEEENGTNDDSAAINFYWETPDFDFGLPYGAKRLNSVHLHAKNTGSFLVTVDHFIDGTTQSYAKTMNVSTEKPIKKFVAFSDRGKFHRLRFTNNAADQDIEIYGAATFAEVFDPGTK